LTPCPTDLETLGRVELPGESEVDDLDLVSVRSDAEDVLRLEVKVEHLSAVDVVDGVADLTHEVDTLAFCQHVIVADDPLQQLPTANAAQSTSHYE